MSNACQINLSNENIKNKHWYFQISKIVSQKIHFGILIHILSWKHFFEINFRLLRRNNKLKTTIFLTNIWRNNWRFSIWHRKKTRLSLWRLSLWTAPYVDLHHQKVTSENLCRILCNIRSCLTGSSFKRVRYSASGPISGP